jgi:hypothetical protein
MMLFNRHTDFAQSFARVILYCCVLFLGATIQLHAQRKPDPLLSIILARATSESTRKVLADPTTYRVQIIYTQIDRDKKGIPHFTNHYFNEDPNFYFNPASMVKMPLAFLALEKLNQLNIAGVVKHTKMIYDSSYPKQVALKKDNSAPDSSVTIAHLIKRAFLISENDPYNRLYQFMGQGPINKILQQKGYTSTQITRQFMGYTEEQNRHTNAIRFYDKNNQQIYAQQGGFNMDSFLFPAPILIGDAHIDRNEKLVPSPFDFTRHNSISLTDMQKMLQAIIFPASVPNKSRFDISEQDRLFLLQYLSQYPSETTFPKYDTAAYYDSYVKFFFNDATHQMPQGVRVFNKVGWAYGFLTDVSYVVDTVHQVDYFLSATLYVNSDGVVNDSKYDEETIGFPFLRELGGLVHQYELGRTRRFRPHLGLQGVRYETRNWQDSRPTIRNADN